MKREWLAHAALLFVAFVWGATFVVVQNAISLVEPFSFNGIRFLLAALILWMAQLFSHKKQRVVFSWKPVQAGFLIGLFLFGGYLFQTFGLLYTTSSKAGFLTGLSIVMIPVFSYVFLKRKTGMFAVIGVGVATIGLFLLTAEDSFSLNKGDLLVLCCAVAFAVHILVNGAYSRKFSALTLSTMQVLAVGVFSTICAFLFEDWHALLSAALWKNGSFLFALVLTSVFATSLAFFIQTAAQQRTSPTRVAIILATEPVFAALAGVLAAGEHLSLSAVIGCACILLGMVFAELPGKEKEDAQAA
ncbi:DMT family transporter [Ectobacillus ponti]|uniref:DMT family transporter n=1 Tax=Ectobacillus ponti TaxID=2961894 RepID=A0AA42BPJ4_9BACI|nr:DMT family transporter [Ectobacillus ponti]MCP8968817.1 DMT family transporter [Ectobacillus ponti]